MRTKHLPIVLSISFLCIIFLQQAYPQGVTTAAMSGIVFDKGNNPLSGQMLLLCMFPPGHNMVLPQEVMDNLIFRI